MSPLLLDLTMEKFFGPSVDTIEDTAGAEESEQEMYPTPASPGRRVIFPGLYGSEQSFSPSRDEEKSPSLFHPNVKTVDTDRLPQLPRKGIQHESPREDFNLFSVARANMEKSSSVPSSILRSSSRLSVKHISSVESDIPSLAETEEDYATPPHVHFPATIFKKPTRTQSEPIRNVSFDARVWVREFKRCRSEREAIWYTPEEMQQFKSEAVQVILRNAETVLVPTGCGRMVQKKESLKLLFSNSALRNDHEEENISKILVVDPHDICLKLFRKGLQYILPRATIITVTSGEQALEELQHHSFDLIVIEERLKLFHRQGSDGSSQYTSGVDLMKECSRRQSNALYVGVSAKLKPATWQGVSDLCWSKPPPTMDESLLEELKSTLCDKRTSA